MTILLPNGTPLIPQQPTPSGSNDLLLGALLERTNDLSKRVDSLEDSCKHIADIPTKKQLNRYLAGFIVFAGITLISGGVIVSRLYDALKKAGVI